MSVLDICSENRQISRFADGIAKTVYFGSHLFMAVRGVDSPQLSRIADIAMMIRIYATTTIEFGHQTNRFSKRIGDEDRVKNLKKLEQAQFFLGYALMGTVLATSVLPLLDKAGLQYGGVPSIADELLSKQLVLHATVDFALAAKDYNKNRKKGKHADLIAKGGELLCQLMAQGVIASVPVLQYGGGLIAGTHKLWTNQPKDKKGKTQ